MPSTVRAHDRRERQGVRWARLAKAQLRLVDSELIALEEDGSVALTRDTSQGFDVRSQVALLKKIAGTPMTPSVRSSTCATTRRSLRSISAPDRVPRAVQSRDPAPALRQAALLVFQHPHCRDGL